MLWLITLFRNFTIFLKINSGDVTRKTAQEIADCLNQVLDNTAKLNGQLRHLGIKPSEASSGSSSKKKNQTPKWKKKVNQGKKKWKKPSQKGQSWRMRQQKKKAKFEN